MPPHSHRHGSTRLLPRCHRGNEAITTATRNAQHCRAKVHRQGKANPDRRRSVIVMRMRAVNLIAFVAIAAVHKPGIVGDHHPDTRMPTTAATAITSHFPAGDNFRFGRVGGHIEYPRWACGYFNGRKRGNKRWFHFGPNTSAGGIFGTRNPLCLPGLGRVRESPVLHSKFGCHAP